MGSVVLKVAALSALRDSAGQLWAYWSPRLSGASTPHHPRAVIDDGPLCAAVVDRQVALSTRIYDLPAGRIGLFAGEGSVTVTDLEIRKRTEN